MKNTSGNEHAEIARRIRTLPEGTMTTSEIIKQHVERTWKPEPSAPWRTKETRREIIDQLLREGHLAIVGCEIVNPRKRA